MHDANHFSARVDTPFDQHSAPWGLYSTRDCRYDDRRWRSSRDTDWYLERLYDLRRRREASWLVADWSRYVIDLNRPASGESLYPGQATTVWSPRLVSMGLPSTGNRSPTLARSDARLEQVWYPYHHRLQGELERLAGLFPKVLLLEAHSIKSVIPRLFPGKLPDFNLARITGSHAVNLCKLGCREPWSTKNRIVLSSMGDSWRGYITRHYGRPSQGIHAVQIELAQSTYLDETNASWDDQASVKVQQVFRSLIATALNWLRELP